jgi:hypothetical protein
MARYALQEMLLRSDINYHPDGWQSQKKESPTDKLGTCLRDCLSDDPVVWIVVQHFGIALPQ